MAELLPKPRLRADLIRQFCNLKHASSLSRSDPHFPKTCYPLTDERKSERAVSPHYTTMPQQHCTSNSSSPRQSYVHSTAQDRPILPLPARSPMQRYVIGQRLNGRSVNSTCQACLHLPGHCPTAQALFKRDLLNAVKNSRLRRDPSPNGGCGIHARCPA